MDDSERLRGGPTDQENKESVKERLMGNGRILTGGLTDDDDYRTVVDQEEEGFKEDYGPLIGDLTDGYGDDDIDDGDSKTDNQLPSKTNKSKILIKSR